MKVFDSTVAEKSRRAITKRRADEAHHCAFSCPIAAAAALPAIATKASCRPGRSIASVSMPGAAVDQRLEQRLGPAFGKLEHPFVALAAGVRRESPSARRRRSRGCASGRSAAAARAPRRPGRRTRPCPWR